ncbi:hypothetical protein SELMODRAFT_418983 [Selaginella moellendorffii]|uniref:Uncharacterized protein n=1 Tax=Selaginella moellendorffii TaxID=88036 RepID=D8S7F7_SELML|nr:dual specificity protein phosphatase 1 [Selaginella moellendorffii]XP_002988556.1 dual specificity protein phosphatase 1 [Selaginella moellendorffii]EFJ10352.1 hypothetical protein SELMODRAFT_128331 [Selaginella moellendorffii]EFJ19597.1 hypothetical protein SELMODRAFT_418983 [Selaginella moellendorffii]|eukprot:XP_002979189.1 dual specificity protein phosphatase 1 [Selaginella moellendorffii]
MNHLDQPRVAKFLRAYLLAKYLRNDNLPCEIEQGLYLGSIGAAFHKAALQNVQITHILTIANALEMPFTRDFKYKRVEVLDSADSNLASHFDDCFAFIDEAKASGGAVLVHCFAGRSRSVTVIVAYLMKSHRWNLSRALELVKSKRPEASPNPGFVLQLQRFEQQLRLHPGTSI